MFIVIFVLIGCSPSLSPSPKDVIPTPVNQDVVLPNFRQATSVEILEDIDSSVLGYQTMIVRINLPNDSYMTAVLEFDVVDEEPPTISLIEGESIVADVNRPWVEPGYIVQDNHSSDPTVDISFLQEDGGIFTTSIPGVYQITYEATDSSGNKAIAIRTVTVEDISPPVLISAEEVVIFVGDRPSLPRITYQDNFDAREEIIVTYSESIFLPAARLGLLEAFVTLEDLSGNRKEYPLSVRVIETPTMLFERLRMISMGAGEGDITSVISEYESYTIFPQVFLRELDALFSQDFNEFFIGGLDTAISLNAYDVVLSTSLEYLKTDSNLDVVSALSAAVEYYQSTSVTLSQTQLDSLIDHLVISSNYMESVEVERAIEHQLEQYRVRLDRSIVNLSNIQNYDRFMDRLDSVALIVSTSYVNQSYENFLIWISNYENDQSIFTLLRRTPANQRYEVRFSSSNQSVQIQATTDTGFTVVGISRDSAMIRLVDGSTQFDVQFDLDQFDQLIDLAFTKGAILLDRNTEIDYEIQLTNQEEADLQRFVERLIVEQIRQKRDT